MSSASIIDNTIEQFLYFDSFDYQEALHPQVILALAYFDELHELVKLAILGVILLIGILLYIRHVKSKEARLKKQLLQCRNELKTLLDNTNAHPLLLRLAWSDAVNYDKTIRIWPFCGGANGSIRFLTELKDPQNAGLEEAIELLTPLKNRYNMISWADLIQMGGALGVELCGGPKLNIFYGRIDVEEDLRDLTFQEMHELKEKYASKRLLAIDEDDLRNRYFPQPMAPYPLGEKTPAQHIRNLSNRLGLSDEEIVALCGAHTIGRAFKERSGVCPFYAGEQGATKYTKLTSMAKGDRPAEVGLSGGCSWTKNWLVFDNSYFRRPIDDPNNHELLWLPTDQALFDFPIFAHFAKAFGEDQNLFFHSYTIAHRKMSEFGSKFEFRIQLDPVVESNVHEVQHNNDAEEMMTRNKKRRWMLRNNLPVSDVYEKERKEGEDSDNENDYHEGDEYNETSDHDDDDDDDGDSSEFEEDEDEGEDNNDDDDEAEDAQEGCEFKD